MRPDKSASARWRFELKHVNIVEDVSFLGANPEMMLTIPVLNQANRPVRCISSVKCDISGIPPVPGTKTRCLRLSAFWPMMLRDGRSVSSAHINQCCLISARPSSESSVIRVTRRNTYGVSLPSGEGGVE